MPNSLSGSTTFLFPANDGCLSELFFADGSNLVGALDLRTGRLLYSYSTMTCTANHLLHIPEPEGRGTNIGLATISNDATLRLHSTVLPPAEGVKRNAIGEGKKPKIVGMVGGVGVGTALWHGWGHIPEEPQRAGAGAEGEDREDGDEEEEAWEGMSEVEDGDGDSYSEAEDVPPKRRKK